MPRPSKRRNPSRKSKKTSKRNGKMQKRSNKLKGGASAPFILPQANYTPAIDIYGANPLKFIRDKTILTPEFIRAENELFTRLSKSDTAGEREFKAICPPALNYRCSLDSSAVGACVVKPEDCYTKETMDYYSKEDSPAKDIRDKIKELSLNEWGGLDIYSVAVNKLENNTPLTNREIIEALANYELETVDKNKMGQLKKRK